MKVIYIFTFYFLCSFSYADVVKLATGEWSPYTSLDLPGKGYFSNFVLETFKRAGYETELNFYPWKRAELFLKEGHVLGLFPYKKTPEREEEFAFTVPLFQSSGVFMYDKSQYKEIKYDDLSELSKYKIGGALGYWYEDLFKEKKLNYTLVSSDLQNINKLLYKRVDLIVTEKSVGWTIISGLVENPEEKIGIVEKPLDVSDLRIMISKKYPNYQKIVEDFNQAYLEFTKTEDYQLLLNKFKKYGPTPVIS